MKIEKYETGSGGFVWQNIQPDELFSRVKWHVYTAYDMTIGKEWASSKFVNHYNRIYYVKSGTATLHFKDFTLTMKPGHLYLIPAYQLVSHDSDGELSFMWLHFQASLDDALDLFMIYGKAMMIDCTEDPELELIFNHMVSAVKESSMSAMFERTRLLLRLLKPFFIKFDEQQSEAFLSFRHQDLLPALELINNNLGNSLEIKMLADTLKLSPEHFSRKFKAAFNVAPKRYITQKRIAFAKQRLLLNKESVESIAEQCGFCDIFHFSRVFKSEVGISPSIFRREYTLPA